MQSEKQKTNHNVIGIRLNQSEFSAIMNSTYTYIILIKQEFYKVE